MGTLEWSESWQAQSAKSQSRIRYDIVMIMITQYDDDDTYDDEDDKNIERKDVSVR